MLKNRYKLCGMFFFFCLICLFFASNRLTADQTKPVFIDQAGRTIKPGPYKRIISLYGAHTENLFSLGLNEEIIGVSSDENYPPEALSKPVFSAKDSIEKFLSVKPDLVLMRPMHLSSYGRLVQRLQDYGVTVAALQVNKYDELYDYWRLLGALSGKESAAEQMIVSFQQKLNDLSLQASQAPEKPGVFVEAFHRGTKTYIEDSLPMWLLKLAGGQNIAADVSSTSNTIVAPFGLERLLASKDKIDVYLIMNGPMNQTQAEDLEKITVYQNIKAIKEHKIFLMEEHLVARPTPRLALGLEKMIKILHNENINKQ